MLNVSDRLKKLVEDIFAQGKTIHGRNIAGKELTVVEGDKISGRVLVPFWLPVFQYGRGPMKDTTTKWETFNGYSLSSFQRAIYTWMEKYNLFESRTDKGKINEAKGLAWYINKYGNKQYRDGRYIDIYDTLTNKAIDDITNDYGNEMLTITSELI